MNSSHRAVLTAALAATLVTTGTAAAKAPKRPDLVVQAISLTGVAHPGSVVTLGDTTLNKGPGGAKKSTTALFLSKDSKRDAGDRRLARHKLGKLAAGKSSTGAKQVTLPKPLAAGSYRLIACADAPGAVTEKKEKNNCASRALTVTPITPPGGGGNPGGDPGGGGPKLDHLSLYPPTANVGVGSSSVTANATFTQTLEHTVTYQVEGYDANGNDLGDFTDQATFSLPIGSCAGATCSVALNGSQKVTATVGDASGAAQITGVPPELSCRGENYDVDGVPSNGCERLQPSIDHTTTQTATSLGGKTCADGAFDASFSGTILSDARKHSGLPGFDGSSGSAAEWYRLQALGTAGGIVSCVRDYKMTIQTTGGSSAKCYRLDMLVAGDPKSYQQPYYAVYGVTVSGNGTATSTLSKNAYDDFSTIYFRVERTCAAAPAKISYTVSYHL